MVSHLSEQPAGCPPRPGPFRWLLLALSLLLSGTLALLLWRESPRQHAYARYQLAFRCLPAQGDPDGRALDARQAQASCSRCHQQVKGLPGAERWTVGLRAYQRLGCGGPAHSRCDPARGRPRACRQVSAGI